ncbi:MAG: filamentous hemagglutinin N-terminal domain-containing protein [Candidatus Omnitrophica bacterium]|nr:filamentous hemagglutinin N-terminal domain-containing protein [Candidatus Omnitrophota bacterium]
MPKLLTTPQQLTLAILLNLMLVMPALGLPELKEVASGQAQFDIQGKAMQVNQATDKMIADYHSFSIAGDEAVRFAQPSASSVALNRVVGADPSAIFGQLQANGQIFLVNPQGVLFGPGSRVDVGALAASTLDIQNQDFLAGKWAFAGEGGAAVVNQGTLTAAPGGYVALIGEQVRNEGVIRADGGSAVLAAGEQLVLQLDSQGLISVVLDGGVEGVEEGGEALVVNAGAVNTEGFAEGNQIVVNAGQIQIVSAGDVVLESGSEISARGRGSESNGGVVNVFGARDGILADGSLIDVRGGEISGDGGFVEFSAARNVELNGGRIEAGAFEGQSGRVLIDPDTIFVNSDYFSWGADIDLAADKGVYVADGVVVSSRQVASGDHLNGASTGRSGRITFFSPHIEIGNNVVIVAHADNGFQGNTVQLGAEVWKSSAWLAGVPFENELTADARLILGKSVQVRGRDIDMTASARSTVTAEIDSDETVSADLTDLDMWVNEDKIFPVDAMGRGIKSEANAELSIGEGTVLAADQQLTVEASSKPTARLWYSGPAPGLMYASSEGNSNVYVGPNANLSAGAEIQITSNMLNTSDLRVEDTSILAGRPNDWPMAYGKRITNSYLLVDEGARISAPGVTIYSDVNWTRPLIEDGVRIRGGRRGAVAVSDNEAVVESVFKGIGRADEFFILAVGNYEDDYRTTAESSGGLVWRSGSRAEALSEFLSGRLANESLDTSGVERIPAVAITRDQMTSLNSVEGGADILSNGDLLVETAAIGTSEFEAVNRSPFGAGTALAIGEVLREAVGIVRDESILDANRIIEILTASDERDRGHQWYRFSPEFAWEAPEALSHDTGQWLGSAIDKLEDQVPSALGEGLEGISDMLDEDKILEEEPVLDWGTDPRVTTGTRIENVLSAATAVVKDEVVINGRLLPTEDWQGVMIAAQPGIESINRVQGESGNVYNIARYTARTDAHVADQVQIQANGSVEMFAGHRLRLFNQVDVLGSGRSSYSSQVPASQVWVNNESDLRIDGSATVWTSGGLVLWGEAELSSVNLVNPVPSNSLLPQWYDLSAETFVLDWLTSTLHYHRSSSSPPPSYIEAKGGVDILVKGNKNVWTVASPIAKDAEGFAPLNGTVRASAKNYLESFSVAGNWGTPLASFDRSRIHASQNHEVRALAGDLMGIDSFAVSSANAQNDINIGNEAAVHNTDHLAYGLEVTAENAQDVVALAVDYDSAAAGPVSAGDFYAENIVASLMQSSLAGSNIAVEGSSDDTTVQSSNQTRVLTLAQPSPNATRVGNVSAHTEAFNETLMLISETLNTGNLAVQTDSDIEVFSLAGPVQPNSAPRGGSYANEQAIASADVIEMYGQFAALDDIVLEVNDDIRLFGLAGPVLPKNGTNRSPAKLNTYIDRWSVANINPDTEIAVSADDGESTDFAGLLIAVNAINEVYSFVQSPWTSLMRWRPVLEPLIQTLIEDHTWAQIGENVEVNNFNSSYVSFDPDQDVILKARNQGKMVNLLGISSQVAVPQGTLVNTEINNEARAVIEPGASVNARDDIKLEAVTVNDVRHRYVMPNGALLLGLLQTSSEFVKNQIHLLSFRWQDLNWGGTWSGTEIFGGLVD